MLRDQYDEVRRDADRARLDAQLALDTARRRAAEIAARLDELRSRARHPGSDEGGDRRVREAYDAMEFARRSHERAARVHDRAAREHDATAEMYDGQGDLPGGVRERAAGVRERQAAEQDRRAAKRNS